MGNEKHVNFTIPQSVCEKIDEEADELNMSRASYIRKHFHAGRRLFQSSGKLDREMLERLVKNDEAAALREEPTIDAEGIEEEILPVLPIDKQRAITKDELRKEIFGTVDKQRDRINKALTYLEDRDQITFTADGGDPVVYKNE